MSIWNTLFGENHAQPNAPKSQAPFATRAELEKIGALSGKGLLLGQLPQSGFSLWGGSNWLSNPLESHQLIIAPPRSGKSVLLQSNLLHQQGSCLTFDVKDAELWHTTAAHRSTISDVVRIDIYHEAERVLFAALGLRDDALYRMLEIVSDTDKALWAVGAKDAQALSERAELLDARLRESLNPSGLQRLQRFERLWQTLLLHPTSRFNPLDYFRQDDPAFLENLDLLISGLIITNPYNSQPYFDLKAGSIALTLLLFVLCELPKKHRNLSQMYHLVQSFKHQQSDWTEGWLPQLLESKALGGTIALRAHELTRFNDREILSVLSSLENHTDWISSQSIREALSWSDCNLNDLKQKPTSVYLVLPTSILKSINRLLRITLSVVAQSMQATTGKPENPVWCYIDEGPALGNLGDRLLHILSVLPSAGMRVVFIAQNLEQIRQIYSAERAAGAFLELFASSLFLSPGAEESKYISTLLGRRWVEVENHSESGSWLGQSEYFQSSQNYSRSTNWQQVETMTAEQVRRTPKAFAFLKGNRAALLDPLKWYEHSALKMRGLENPLYVNPLSHS
jgi:type IV secretory pathway TraG/TraD family ATPase VirD4